LHKLHEITGDQEALRVSLKWFKERFEIGTTKNVNTMSPLLTAAYLHESKHADYYVHLDAWAEWVRNERPACVSGSTNVACLGHVRHAENRGRWLTTYHISRRQLSAIMGRYAHDERTAANEDWIGIESAALR
jgi:rhamnogalacturonyl hydrolase YesR